MKQQQNRKPEGNLYDKVFKENAEQIFMPLVEQTLGIKIKHYKPWKEKMQTTLEREYDFFYEVETETGDRFILHLEYQTENDPEMVYRKAEYHGIALRKRKMHIKHIGEAKPTMPSKLPPEHVYDGFELIDVHSLDTEKLLTSQVPEMVMWAVLSNYPKEKAEEILQTVVQRLKELSKNKTLQSRYLKQLIILSRLRKLEDLTIQTTSAMPVSYNIETDYLYKQGVRQGMQQGMQQKSIELVPKLFSEVKMGIPEIAALLGLSIEEIKETLTRRQLL